MTKITNHTEVTIIGGGPGGLSAAYELVNQGISVSLIDENSLLGGQFLRQLTPEFIKNKKTFFDINIKEYNQLLNLINNPYFIYINNSIVWNILDEMVIVYVQNNQTKLISSNYIIVASGAYDRAVPFPGWTLPGVMTVGGVLNLLKSQLILPGKNIIVSGTEINVNPTAELTWALILGLARNIKFEIDNMYQGYWQTTIGVELKGKILGLIGLGKVGSQVAKIAKAFDMQVISWSENLDLNQCKKLDVLAVNKEDLLKTLDFISIHVVLGDRYRELIKLKEFDMMKKTAFLINTSRGPIINEDDLIIALSTNVIAGAGIDVYEKEPLPDDHKLRFLPNALLLPHLGYVTAENYSIFYTQMLENLEACVSGKPIRVIE